MKLPFTIKMPNVGGVFARLNPMALLAKFKKGKGGGKDDHGLPDEDEDLFGDLGDLDKIEKDAADAANQGKDLDDLDDLDRLDGFDDDHDHDEDEIDVLDEVDDDANFADLDVEDDLDHPSSSSSPSDASSDVGDLDDFDLDDPFDGEDDDLEADEAAQKQKLKKLGIMAGGGVVLAVVLGGLAWWLLGGDGAPEQPASGIALPANPNDTVISLDGLPAIEPKIPPPAKENEPASAAPSPQQEGDPAPSTPASKPAPAATAGAPAGGSQDRSRAELNVELSQLGLDSQMEPGAGLVIPAGTQASFANVPAWPAGDPLSEAPNPALVQQGEDGMLPRIDKDGLSPFDAYKRPDPPQSGDPKIAVIVTGLGLSRAATEAAIDTMPPDVTLSLNVYARGLDFWVKRAREAGHEVLLEMPSETADFPFSDPGPNALQALAAPETNLQQLQWMLSRTIGYFGVLAVDGSKFLTVEEQVSIVIEELKSRGLMYVDGGFQGSQGTRVAYKEGAKWAAVEINLDEVSGRKALEVQLNEFETLAKKRALSIAKITSAPGNLDVLSTWLRGLKERGLVLQPVSALANKQLIR